MIAVLSAVTAPTAPMQASPLHAAPVNCNGYVAGMQVLARDVQGFVDRASVLHVSSARLQERGMARELQTVLQANGKPVDNFKVVRRMKGAMDSVVRSVDARESLRSITQANAFLDRSRFDLADIQVLLREICLPSKIRRLPCGGSCVISLLGTGRVIARERPWITFVVPTNYTVRYAWNCRAASARGKNLRIVFEDYANAVRTTHINGEAFWTTIVDAAGAERSGSVVRDSEYPQRKLLLLVAEQACQWKVSVSKG